MVEINAQTNSIQESATSGVRVPGFSFNEAELRGLGYQIIDEIATYLTHIQDHAVWQAMPEDVRTRIQHQALPEQSQPFEETLDFLREVVLPYPQGNGHPRFSGWINSAPAHVGILLKPLEAALNPNCGIGEHAGQELERRIVQWVMELCSFPIEGSAGVFVSGGSEANFTCLQAARHWAAQIQGWDVRKQGIQGLQNPFVLYQSDQGHFSVRKCVEAMGLGSDAIRIIPSTPTWQIDVDQLARRIRADRAAGLTPFCVVATAGTVETGSIDPFNELADLCAEEKLWLHVDGSYGAFGILDQRVKPLYKGLERADSLATDQHKWLSVPIDCGCALVRHGTVLHDTFRLTHTEVEQHEAWMSEYTLQRTRRFRALDVWAVVRTAGRTGLANAIARNIDMAQLFAGLIREDPSLELVANGPLSIVRFRYAPPLLLDQPHLLDRLNKALARTIQERGNAFFTSTHFAGKEVLRACFVNYMTTEADIHAMFDEVRLTANTMFLPLE
ncbi:MAG TPA: pyridoxal-dependent decarboxylase [Ktedonobacteraceae bacterium]|jgi:glutamate/tyrosine decarboxylase-like PLP-dependent enzyme